MLFQFLLFSTGLTHVSCTLLFMGHIEEFVIEELRLGSDHQVIRYVPESFERVCARKFCVDLVMSLLLNRIDAGARSPQWTHRVIIHPRMFVGMVDQEDLSQREGSWRITGSFTPFISLEKLHLITHLPWKHRWLMFLHGRCAKLARVHFNLSFTGSDNEVLTSQQMGLTKQFCLLLAGSVGQSMPEHVAFISSGVAFGVRGCRVPSQNNSWNY